MDINAYSAAMDEFLEKMGNIPEIVHPDNADALRSICGVLRVARVKLTMIEKPRFGVNETKKAENLLFDSESADDSRILEFSHLTGDGNKGIYTFFQRKGEPDWDEEERSKINLVESMLFVFHGRVRTQNIAETLTFYDRQFHFYNLNYFFKMAEKYTVDGTINQYTGVYFNLKSFGYLNRLLGREKGDEVMCEYIHILEKKLSDSGFVVRIGGDNFAALFLKKDLDIVIEHCKGVGIVYDKEANEKVLVSATAGFYVIPESGVKLSSDVMDNISVAIGVARSNKERIAFYSENIVNEIN
ncbi:MAG: diguanylate cyclase domain-containing protein, partial [Oscillospiraceae bacterium]